MANRSFVRRILQSFHPKCTLAPERTRLVAVHHKTGTKWMLDVFRSIAIEFGEDTCNVHRPGWEKKKAGICFILNGRVPEVLLARDYRGLHLIRDPRDVVLSGIDFHMDSDEWWLHCKRKEFGGRSYQETIRTLAPHDRFEFELEHKAGQYLDELRVWDFNNPRFYEARYEELVVDNDCAIFRDILAFLKVPGERRKRACEIFVSNSLFSGAVSAKISGHVRDGRPCRWKTQMTRRQGERFIEKSGDLLLKLGYEPDHRWVDRLSVRT